MTEKELNKLEAELQRRGYKKYTSCLTSSESWAWFKTFCKEKDEDGHVVKGYQVAFRVWDWKRFIYRDKNMQPFGFDFWTSSIVTDSRMDFTSNWEPICDIGTFERMAAVFNALTRRFITKTGKQ